MKLNYLLIFAILSTVLACSKQSEQQAMVHQAVAIESSDECHLCGMLISRFDGPKGQLFRQGVSEDESNTVKKFCSTRDMFSFYLDPEHQRNVTTMLVHDMSKMPWHQPNGDYFIDARQAWFVINSRQNGAMGKTLASFSTKTDAQAFSEEFGGEVIAFEQIDLAALH